MVIDRKQMQQHRNRKTSQKKTCLLNLARLAMFWTPQNANWKKLQEMALAQAIPLQKIVPSIKPGWVGKQKGLLQVLWEQGWIDAACLEEHATIKKDDVGAIDREFSLQCILASCLDFANETTELQMMGEKMGLESLQQQSFMQRWRVKEQSTFGVL
jgi:hypothetical protein